MSIQKKTLLDEAIAKSVGQIADFISPLVPVGKFHEGGFVGSGAIPESAKLPLKGEVITILNKPTMIPLIQSPDYVIPKDRADELRRKMTERLDRSMTEAFGASTSVTVTANAAPDDQEPMTAEKMLAVMNKVRKEIGKLPMLVSSAQLPVDSITTFTFEDRKYCGAHPDLWDQVKEDIGTGYQVESQTGVLFNGVEIIDIDADTPDARKERGNFYHAMAGAMLGDNK